MQDFFIDLQWFAAEDEGFGCVGEEFAGVERVGAVFDGACPPSTRTG